jgi:hypothetical protein
MAEGLMMNNDKTGGAAFPHVSTHMDRTGMTLRDYFAAQTIAVSAGLEGEPDSKAKAAYQIADAMIAEREKVGE